jgi:hypothetical protein
MKKFIVFLAILLCGVPLQADEEVKAWFLSRHEALMGINIDCSQDGSGAVVLLNSLDISNYTNSDLISHQLLISKSGITVKIGKKITSPSRRARAADIAFDKKSKTFLAIWYEYVKLKGIEKGVLFTQQFNSKGARKGGRKIVYQDPQVDYLSPAIVNHHKPTANKTYSIVFMRRIAPSDPASGLYTATMSANGKITSIYQVTQNDLWGDLLFYQPIELFVKPNGTLIVGLFESYYNKNRVRFNRYLARKIQPTPSIKSTKRSPNYFNLKTDNDYDSEYRFVKTKNNTYVIATLSEPEGSGAYFRRFKENLQPMGGKKGIANDSKSEELAMVTDSNGTCYAVMQKSNGVLVVPLRDNGHPNPSKSRFFTFSDPARAYGAFLEASYSKKAKAIVVVFVGADDGSPNGTPIYAALLPIG